MSEIKTFDKISQVSSRSVVVFVGCGLSIPEPTCLPLNRELISSFLKLDWVEDEEKIPLNFNKINKKKYLTFVLNIYFQHSRNGEGLT